jgi:transketolase
VQHPKLDVAALENTARQIRRDIVTMTHAAGSGHPGGSLSAADFVAALYFHKLRHDPQNPHWPDRDRVVFSKGHVAPVLYAALARSGYFPPDDLPTLRRLGSHLQGHPCLETPGVEVGSGSLGQGVSVAVGMALAARRDGLANLFYAVCGDGEMQEGQIWEALMAAGHFGLDNLLVFVDHNNLQIDGWVEDVMGIEPLADKLRAFRFNVVEVDGHDMAALVAALGEFPAKNGRPTALVAKTIKGKGVSFMENQAGWHGRAPSDEELARALSELADPEGAS